MSVDFKVPQTSQPEGRPGDAAAASVSGPAAAAVPIAVTLPAVTVLPAAAAPAWGLARRITFRFACCYLVLYNLPVLISELPIPGISSLISGYFELWDVAVLWSGKRVLHLGRAIQVLRGKTGSGDTTYDYVQLLCFAAVAAVAALAWTLAARRAREHRRAHEWLRIYLRYSLGAIVLGYGMSKVIKTQFPFPASDRLMEPLGEGSPMGLLWTFMGFSTPYTVFAGAMEVLGGVLLFFRRTTTLGALVVIAVMSNVVLLNFSYDVPVKLFSLHLLAMALFLVLPDFRRLANVLVWNRPAEPASLAPPWSARWVRIAARVASLLFLGFLLYGNSMQGLHFLKTYGPGAKKPPIYGIYEVEEFIRDGRTVPPLLTEASRWRRLTSRYSLGMAVRTMDDAVRRYRLEFAPGRRVAFFGGEPEAKQGAFAWSAPDKDHVVLEGLMLKDALTVKLRRVDETKLLLLSRGFHWISEFPLNR
jgi:uncharacterized membrane protein YphA (DoxX/SURF4 family)